MCQLTSAKGILEWWLVWIWGIVSVNSIWDGWPSLIIVINLGNRRIIKDGIT
jgi:hypothetical protein